MKIITGKDLSEELYLKTWELDNNTFEEKDKLTKEQALDFFYRSNRSTIVLIDDKNNKLIGYITPFLLKRSFSNDYIISDLYYKDALEKDVFCEPKEGVEGDIYIFSTVVIEGYRDKKLDNNKTAITILTEALVEWICDIKKQGVSIDYVYADRVSADGEKYLKSIKLKKCFATTDDDKFAGLFNPYMFEKCENVNKLYELYSDKNMRKPYDKTILNNHEYLSIKNGELYFKDIKLLDLVKEYGNPLEVAYTPIIKEKVKELKSIFEDKIIKYKYDNKYNYAYATKANYYSEVILEAIKSVDMIETSSAYDINIIIKLRELNIIKYGYTVICNGYKNETYVENIKKLLDMGVNVIPVIENKEEYDILQMLKDYKLNVGLRYNSDFEARLIKNKFAENGEFDNRFGLNEEEIFEMANRIENHQNFNLKLFHFHFGGTISNIDNYVKGMCNIFELYCKLKQRFNTLEYFDFGGGFPVKYSLTYNFNYEELIDKMIRCIKNISKNNNVKEPALIGEHGRYTVADHGFYIYRVDFTKNNWYIINSSFMNMTPDMWGIDQDFTILPINLINNECIPVYLGGETCDPDDRYYLKDNNVKLFMPIINDGEELYIAIFSTGAYQENISGIGGVHHCMIPEGNELIIYQDKKGKRHFYKANDKQTPEEMLNLLDYNEEYISEINN